MGPDGKLGRGLDSLMGSERVIVGEVRNLPLDQISPNPFQPRERIEPAALEGLIESIQENGILQPVTVRPSAAGYELVTGERRYRAAQELGMAEIPAVIREVTDGKMLELALIENIQREDLNPMEKAKAFRQLIETFHLTQEEAARRLGQERSTVANYLRLLDLPAEVQEIVSRGTITMGHARALLAVKDPKRQFSVCQMIVKKDLSVRETEHLCGLGKVKPKSKSKGGSRSPHIREIEEDLRLRLGTKVHVMDRNNRGRIIIEYYNPDDFQRIMGCIKKH